MNSHMPPHTRESIDNALVHLPCTEIKHFTKRMRHYDHLVTKDLIPCHEQRNPKAYSLR